MFKLPDNYESFVILTEEGIIQYCSPPFAALLDVNSIQLIGTHIDSCIKPTEPVSVSSWFSCDAVTNGYLRSSTKHVHYLYKTDSVNFGTEKSGTMLFIEEEDLTPMKTLNGLYAHAFHLNPGLSAITVLKTGKHLDVNKAWLGAMGYERHEIIGKTSSDLRIWKEGDKVRSKIVHQLLKNGKEENLETKMRTKNGEFLDIIVSAKLVKHHGQLLAFFASHNVTDLKRADKLRFSLKQKVDNWSRIALVDALTAIPNRRQFDQTISTEWKRCGRYGKPLALLLIDIDHFKYYNDHYGHQAGDECLRIIAQTMNKQTMRPGDMLCRYGGEEFCCILPESNLKGAHQVAICLLQAVNNLKIAHEKSPVASYVTISIGIASTTPNVNGKEESLISEADRNLYKAKANGRARIEGGSYYP